MDDKDRLSRQPQERLEHAVTTPGATVDAVEFDPVITQTLLQLVDYELPDPAEDVGVDPYNTAAAANDKPWPFNTGR